ncbi:MAG TPA: biotin--[acetyl-CoA-carboxylase] ligase [Burkholderiaceae bacterium]|nr:biotin--[acetyl-CoA-carboxylase] ligase [Burkholderiaceae bacterium]
MHPTATTSPDIPALPPHRQIDSPRLHAALDVGPRTWALDIVTETGSTNSDLLQLARTRTDSSPLCRLAYLQTAGRGRQGRPWAGSPSLTFSLAYPFPFDPQALSGLSLVCGLALANGIADYAPAARGRVRVKWPNDLEVDGSKLSGILIETARAGSTLWAVIGMGLNLSRPPGIEAALGRPIACVDDLMPPGQPIDSTALFAAILNQLAGTLAVFAREGMPSQRAAWEALDAYRGRAVRLLRDQAVVLEGIARGIDDSGQLLVETPSGVQAVMSGEVSLRPATT